MPAAHRCKIGKRKRAGQIGLPVKSRSFLKIDLASASPAKKIYANCAEPSQCDKGPGRRLWHHVEGEDCLREVELSTSKIVGLRRVTGVGESRSEDGVTVGNWSVGGDVNSYGCDKVTRVGDLSSASVGRCAEVECISAMPWCLGQNRLRITCARAIIMHRA